MEKDKAKDNRDYELFFKQIRKPKQKSNAEIEKEEGISIDDFESQRWGPPTEILDFLVLGSYYDVKKHKLMDSMQIGYVLNVAEECDNLYAHDDVNKGHKVRYKKLVVPDMVNERKLPAQWQTFEEAFKFIDQAREAYEKTLKQTYDDNSPKRFRCIVHCMRGRSRSASIVLAYLVNRMGWTLADAFSHVKQRRKIIGPHMHLKAQLVQYEMYLRNKSTMTLAEWKKTSYS